VTSPSATLQVAGLRAEAGETAERARRADASAEAAAAAARRRESGPPPPPPSRTKWTRLVHPSVLIGHVSSTGTLAERVAALVADAARGGGDADQAHARARAAETRLGAAEAEGAAARREAEVHREAADAAREQLLAAQNALAAQDERRTALELNVALLAQARPALEICLLVDSCRWQRPRVLFAP